MHRLGRGKDLATLMRCGRRVFSPLFQLVMRPSTFPDPRFVIVAGRTVDKRAVVRNRLRRRVREYIRTHLVQIAPARDVGIIIKKEAAAASRNDFYDALKQILSRVR